MNGPFSGHAKRLHSYLVAHVYFVNLRRGISIGDLLCERAPQNRSGILQDLLHIQRVMVEFMQQDPLTIFDSELYSQCEIIIISHRRNVAETAPFPFPRCLAPESIWSEGC